MADEQQEQQTSEQEEAPQPPPPEPRWRPAAEPTCCGSGCHDCPF